ncbi:MAG: hypothetical protein WED10_12935 [Brumimicrobium sp.]
MRNLFYILFFALTILSCKKSDDTPEFGYEYFGLDKGKFVTYDVMEIFHDVELSPSHDTVRYTLKTVVGEDIVDNENRTASKIFRYAYDAETDELIDERVWTAIIDQGRGEIVEENQRKIRLVFAITSDKTWNVNAFNTDDPQEVYYEDLFKPYSIGGSQIDSSVRVEYEDFFSLVDHRRKYEVYGKNIGLIHRSFKDLTIKDFDTTAIQYGTEVHYSLKDYGVE